MARPKLRAEVAIMYDMIVEGNNEQELLQAALTQFRKLFERDTATQFLEITDVCAVDPTDAETDDTILQILGVPAWDFASAFNKPDPDSNPE